MKLFGPIAPVGSGGARSGSFCPFQLTPIVGPPADAVTARFAVAECVVDVPVPVTVSEYVATGVVPAVVTVRTALAPDVIDAGAKVPVAPTGSPLTARLTDCAAPDVTCVMTDKVVVAPCTTLRVAGVTAIEKSSMTGALTVRLTDTVCVVGGEAYAPWIVSVYVPAATPVVVTVSVELAPAVTDAGLNAPVAPKGSPLTENEIVCGVPVTTCVVTEYEALAPCTTLALEGDAPTLKSSACGAEMVTVTDVERVVDEPVPVIVSVNVPVGVAAPAVTVSVELPPVDTEAGVNVPLASGGRPASDSAIVCALPDVSCVLTV